MSCSRSVCLAAVGVIPADLTPLLAPGQGTPLVEGDAFGFSVAAEGDTVAVGAIGEYGPGGEEQGSAYVFVLANGQWRLQSRLQADDGSGGDNFGSAVALSGDTLAVGAFHRHGPAGVWQGAVYVFVREGGRWTQQARLLASNGSAYDALGSSVDVDGDTVVAGAWGYRGTIGSQAGAAYVFTRSGTTWSQSVQLTRSGGARPSDVFGHSVAVSGTVIAVGCDGYDGPAGSEQGMVQIFAGNGSGWIFRQQLTPQPAAAGDYFGRSIDLDGPRLVVGGYGHTGTAGSQQGSAWIFEHHGTSWAQQAKLVPQDTGVGDNFGWSVAIRGDRVLVGAPQSAGPGTGKGYLFARDGQGWRQAARLIPARPDGNQRFGFSVGLARTLSVAGAWHGAAADGSRPGGGVAYQLTPQADLNGDGRVDQVDVAFLRACMCGPGVPYALGLPPDCPLAVSDGRLDADLNSDGQVDQQDFGLLQRCLSPGAVDVDCAR